MTYIWKTEYHVERDRKACDWFNENQKQDAIDHAKHLIKSGDDAIVIEVIKVEYYDTDRTTIWPKPEEDESDD